MRSKQELVSDLQCEMADAVYQKYQQDLYSLQACPDDYSVDQMEEDKLLVTLRQSGVSCHHNSAPKVPALSVCDRTGLPGLATLNPASNFPAFIFVQPSPTGIWIIQHNLGYNPIVTFKDTLGNSLVGTITYSSVNILTVTFQQLVSGTAFLYPNPNI